MAAAPEAYSLTFSEPVSPLSLRLVGPDGGAVELDPRTRMIYRGRSVFINGERFAPPAAALLRRLADDRRLDAEVLRRALGDGTLDETLVDHLYRWWAAGWLRHHSAGRNAGRTRPAMVKS
ncbi:MAG TPA: hypothetical protein PKA20_06525 [Burkholderiaceae bacterium]|nr:hypothetical protein [Burkholderiaceae bacterium]